MDAGHEFVNLNDLASSQVGSKILFATDDWFAVAENLLKPEPPEWREGVFTEYGKWMDGWETRRKRIPGHDWCIIQLGIPGVVKGLDIDTSYFTGNFPPKVSVQAVCLKEDRKFPDRESKMGTKATEEQTREIAQLKTETWTELLDMCALKPGYPQTCHNYFSMNSSQRWTHIRFNLYPDGGVARLRVYGQAVREWEQVSPNEALDVAAMVNGGLAVACSDMHYGHPRNLIAPGRAIDMGGGWETARRLDRPSILEMGADGCLKVPGCEWVVLRLGHPAVVKEIEVDTNHFKGNFPDSCQVEGAVQSEEEEMELKKSTATSSVTWKPILTSCKLSAHKRHFFTEVTNPDVISHVKLTILPDGGISRLRVWGFPRNLSSASKL